VPNEKDPHLIAGAAGVGATLGADFVKVNPPRREGADSAELLKEAVQAAGRTRLVCSGGSRLNEREFLETLYRQIHIGGASGNATGRNLHQHAPEDAIRFANAIYAITVENAEVDEAIGIFEAAGVR
jgi:fructose-bisphosphate aldolase/6-deoxy-5-ketofructose 1-phosphate synthase